MCLSAMIACLNQDGHNLSIGLAVSVRQKTTIATTGVATLESLAEAHEIPHRFVESVKSESAVGIVAEAFPDYVMVIGLSELAPTSILDAPMTTVGASRRHGSGHGVIGMHPTLLPEGRGRAPIPWTIIKGLRTSGVTAFLLEEEPDAGGIVLQRKLLVGERETATTLFKRMGRIHGELGRALVPLLAERRLTWVEQSQNAVSVWPRRTREDGLIDFSDSVTAVDRLIRALTPPYPGAYFHYRGMTVVIHEAYPIQQPCGLPPGTIARLTRHGAPIISCGDGVIECRELNVSDATTFLPGEVVNVS
ncbi:methionyl-tRNA formyltransferase [Microbispora sp. H10885]|uniref:methionyl-tRNA formyltransferase n=1 Tax=Microbispora sp. H10885 TaxID=2729110 RepID=UPI0037C7F158